MVRFADCRSSRLGFVGGLVFRLRATKEANWRTAVRVPSIPARYDGWSGFADCRSSRLGFVGGLAYPFAGDEGGELADARQSAIDTCAL